MGGKTGRFRRTDRLRRSSEFRAVSRSSVSVAEPAFVVLVAARSEGPGSGCGPRLGMTVSRRVGGAVVRNRVKRSVREWFRRSRNGLGRDLELVVIARRAAVGLSSLELNSILSGMLRRSGSGGE